jgi:PAS domain S-box-containing protein
MYSLLAALDQAADGAYVIDENQHIVYWNQVAQDMLGYSSDEVLGRSCHEVIQGRDEHDHNWCRATCQVVATVRQGQAVETFNVCARSKTGALRWLNVSILTLPVAATSGAKLVLHLFRDASEARQRDIFARQVLSLVDNLQPAPVTAKPLAASERTSQRLTDREHEVLGLLARGHSTDDIAQSLSISVATVRNHIQSILQKLQVRSRAAAVAYAFDHGLVSHT